jgi:DNA-directed RNA polymerase specialized sigma24 family protein
MDQNPKFQTSGDTVDSYDDVDLLVRIADRDRDEADSDAAFTTFFERHAEFLRLACIKYHYQHATMTAEDVVMLTMTAIYRGEAMFNPPPRASSEFIRKSLRKWLIVVSRNKFCSEIRKLRFDQNFVSNEPICDAAVTPEIYDMDENDSEPGPSAGMRAQILSFRDRLSEIDQIIFDRSIEYFNPKTLKCDVPPEVAQDIATQVGKAVTAVRKRRQRMMNALKETISGEVNQSADHG